jgi:glycosyltransferase involved in cell wall biosynthesis
VILKNTAKMAVPPLLLASESYPPLEISVVIPVYNEQENLGKCLEAVYQSKYPPCEVIVVDDCSTDDSLAVAERFPCRVIKLQEKHGAARAKNRGAEEAKGDIIFFTDADVLLEGDTLSLMVENFADPQISGVVGLLGEDARYSNFCSDYKNLWMHYTYARLSANTGAFYTSAAAIRRDVFKKSGGFDENYRGASVTEDAEFGQRLLTAGHKIYLDKRMTVRHLKRYYLIELIKTDFWRSYGLTMTRLRNKLGRIYGRGGSQTARTFTTVPWFFILSVLVSFLTMLSLLLFSITGFQPVKTRPGWPCYVAALIGCITILLLNFPFLDFLRKERGWSFLGKSCGFLLVDTLVVVFGMLFAGVSFIAGKKF